MYKVSQAVAVLLAVGLAVPLSPYLQEHAQAQSGTPQRIDWIKRGRSLVWEEKVPAKGVKMYVFYARKGQKLSLGFIDDTGVGSMDLGKYSVEPNTDPMSMTVPVTKDYTLTVINNSSKATSFRISFDLQDPKPTAKPVTAERIKLRKGEQVAELKGTLGPKKSKKYVAYVTKGNMIAVVPHDHLSSSIRVRLDGKEFDFRDSTMTEHQKVSKDHTIEIYNTGNKSTAFGFDVGFAEHG